MWTYTLDFSVKSNFSMTSGASHFIMLRPYLYTNKLVIYWTEQYHNAYLGMSVGYSYSVFGSYDKERK